jgi:ubiquinol-cytochrome c reductase cytochrome b subunit
MAEWIDAYVPSRRMTQADLADNNKAEALTRRLRIADKPGAIAKLRDMANDVLAKKIRVAEQFAEGQLVVAPADHQQLCSEEEEDPPADFIIAYLRPELDDIALALSAQAQLPAQAVADAAAAEDGRLARGLEIIKTTCAKGCHRIGDAGQLGLAPDLTGYGSYEWMMGMISDPTHRRYYGPENDRMQSYGESLDDPLANQLTPLQISLVADWLRGDFVGSSEEFVGPHDAQQAQRAWEFARMTETPPAKVVGAPPGAETSQRAQAEQLFAQNCAACHSHANEHGVGIVAKQPSAPNLYGFASRAWIDGLLDPEKIVSSHYFGNTKHKSGDMATFVESDLDREEENFDALVAALSAEAALPAQKDADEKAAGDGTLEKGREAMIDTFGCTNCHQYGEEGEGNTAPLLTGYGSREWIAGMIANPQGEGFYPDSNDRMPAFAGHAKSAGRLLSDEEINLLARFIRGEPLDAGTAVAP